MNRTKIPVALLWALTAGCAGNDARLPCNAPDEFAMIDKDRDCRIVSSEWLLMVRKAVFHLPASKAKDQFEHTQLGLFYQLDRDNDSFIDHEEWVSGNFTTVQ